MLNGFHLPMLLSLWLKLLLFLWLLLLSSGLAHVCKSILLMQLLTVMSLIAQGARVQHARRRTRPLQGAPLHAGGEGLILDVLIVVRVVVVVVVVVVTSKVAEAEAGGWRPRGRHALLLVGVHIMLKDDSGAVSGFVFFLSHRDDSQHPDPTRGWSVCRCCGFGVFLNIFLVTKQKLTLACFFLFYPPLPFPSSQQRAGGGLNGQAVLTPTHRTFVESLNSIFLVLSGRPVTCALAQVDAHWTISKLAPRHRIPARPGTGSYRCPLGVVLLSAGR
jgi:hypothetical protein